MTSEGARGAASKQQLLMAALEVFGHYGFDAGSIRDISERAGQNVAAIAYHFGSKEGLYLAVAELLAGGIAAGTASVLEPSRRYVEGGRRSHRQTEQHLASLLRALAISLFATARGSAPALFVLREQSAPTAAFEVLFERLLRPMHETITALVADRVGIDPLSAEAVVRAHALIGQCVGFKAAKATLARRTGWASADDPGEENVTLIADVIVEHALAALRAAAARARSARAPRRSRRRTRGAPP